MRVAAAARPAPVRALVRQRARRTRAAARARARARPDALGEDRSHRRRPVRRSRGGPGLQVGQERVLGATDRERVAAPDPALHARPAGPRGARAAPRPLPAALPGAARPRAGARRPRGRVRGSEAETLPGYVSHDYLDEEAFWGMVESARQTATRLAGRVRGGGGRRDPPRG